MPRMPRTIEEEIRQTKPLRHAESSVFLSLQRTADQVMAAVTDVLKAADLSFSQYNALRILRGAGEGGLNSSEVGIRMIKRDPDVTRLLDRLEARGLVQRRRDPGDRRVITARITKMGARLLDQLDARVEEAEKAQLEHLGPRRLHQLGQLLDLVRDRR